MEITYRAPLGHKHVIVPQVDHMIEVVSDIAKRQVDEFTVAGMEITVDEGDGDIIVFTNV